MRQVTSGPTAIPPAMLESVVRNLTFNDATPALPRSQPVFPSVSTGDDPSENPSIASTELTCAPIRVVLRVRPLNQKELSSATDTCVTRSTRDPDVVRIRPLDPKRHSVKVRLAGLALFRFEHIFDQQSSQSDVFEQTALPMIEGLFRGQSAVVFAYGVTCSGKTWTIQGSDDHPGILPRSLDVIVNSIAFAKGEGLMQESEVSAEVADLTEGRLDTGARRMRLRTAKQNSKKVHDSHYIEVDGEIGYNICASYLEIYNEQCYDLFEPQPPSDRLDMVEGSAVKAEYGTDTARKIRRAVPIADSHRNPRAKQVLKLKEDSHGEVYAEGITEVEIRSRADIDRLLEFGQQNRFVASTTANETSSRSHAVFFITLKFTETISQARGPPKIVHSSSRLSIVDLAGSERTARTNSNDIRQMESNKINTSLMNLARCLEVMRKNQKNRNADPPMKQEIVPFRNSRLTRLLHHSLESGSAVMIANVSPARYDADDTIHALRCAAIARQVYLTKNKKRIALKDRSNVLKNLDLNIVANDSTNTCRKPTTRSVRTRGLASKESRNITGIAKPRAADPKDKALIASLRKEVNLLRMELEDERCENDLAKEEMYKENHELFKQNEKLMDKLADSEARICLVEQEVREQVVDEAEKIINHLQQTYQKQIDASWDMREQEPSQHRVSVVCDTERRENAERLANRVAMRASRAAFDGIKISLAENDSADETSGGVDDEEYMEDEDEDTPTVAAQLRMPF